MEDNRRKQDTLAGGKGLPPEVLPHLKWIESQEEAMIASLVQLARINSGSGNIAGLMAMAEHLRHMFLPTGGEIEFVTLPSINRMDDTGTPVSQELGPLVRVVRRPEALFKVLLVGHMDTVFPEDHPFQDVAIKPNGVMQGPGVADLKGGLVIMLTALKCLERSPWAEKIGWEVILNPDEEIGSIGSSPFLEEAAGRHQIGLVYEPPPSEGHLVGSRKGSGSFTIAVRGKSAHAGRDFHQGRNAVHAVAELISALYRLNDRREGLTVNPGYVNGGGPVNVVPDQAVTRFNIRIGHPDDAPWVLQRIEELCTRTQAAEGITVSLQGQFTRPPKIIDEKHEALFDLIDQCGHQLGMAFEWRPSGGCCDGNNLAAAGLTNIDTLGAVGGNIHTAEEYVLLESLVARAKLSALLLFNLASGRAKLSV